MDTISFTVPFVPPSVNHYKKPVVYRKRGRIFKSFTLTEEAKAYKRAVAAFAQGRTLVPNDPKERKLAKYELWARIYLGPRQRGDGDNFNKVLGDGLQDAGVILNDNAIKRWHVEKFGDDRKHPRTEITISRIAK
jgi:Holliday junction resolvase RusA-like endonuclease